MGLFIRTVGIARARIKIGMANLAYNFQRLAWLETGVLNGIPVNETDKRDRNAGPHGPKAAIRSFAPPSEGKSRFFEVSN